MKTHFLFKGSGSLVVYGLRGVITDWSNDTPRCARCDVSKCETSFNDYFAMA